MAQQVTLLFSAKGQVNAEPPILNLDPLGKRELATISFKGENVGLVTLRAKLTGWPTGCAGLDLPIDTGFNRIAKISSDLVGADATTGARLHLTGGEDKTFTVLFRNVSDKEVRLGSGVTVLLESTGGALLSIDSKKESPQIAKLQNETNPKNGYIAGIAQSTRCSHVTTWPFAHTG